MIVRDAARRASASPTSGSGAKPTPTRSSISRSSWCARSRRTWRSASVSGGGKAAGPEVAGEDHVELCGVETDLGDQREPGHQAEHETELAVDRLRVRQLVLDERGADAQQDRIPDATHDRAGERASGSTPMTV